MKLGLRPLSAIVFGMRGLTVIDLRRPQVPMGCRTLPLKSRMPGFGSRGPRCHGDQRRILRFLGPEGPRRPRADTECCFEKRVIEGAFGYLKLLKALDFGWALVLGMGLFNVKKSFLYTDPRFQFGGGAFEGDQELLPDIVEMLTSSGLGQPAGCGERLCDRRSIMYGESMGFRDL